MGLRKQSCRADVGPLVLSATKGVTDADVVLSQTVCGNLKVGTLGDFELPLTFGWHFNRLEFLERTDFEMPAVEQH